MSKPWLSIRRDRIFILFCRRNYWGYSSNENSTVIHRIFNVFFNSVVALRIKSVTVISVVLLLLTILQSTFCCNPIQSVLQMNDVHYKWIPWNRVKVFGGLSTLWLSNNNLNYRINNHLQTIFFFKFKIIILKFKIILHTVFYETPKYHKISLLTTNNYI